MNGYRKILTMVKDRKDSKNYSFDRYMNLHLKKAAVIFNICYTKKYIEDQKELKEYKSNCRVDELTDPDDGFIEYESPKKTIVAKIDLTKENAREKEIVKRNLFNETKTNTDIITIPSTQSQEVVEATNSEIVTIQSTQSLEVVDATLATVRDGRKKRNIFKTPDTNEIITIPSTQSQKTIEETHATFASVRDEAISDIILSQDSQQLNNCTKNVEIHTEEVLNQPYDYFDMLVLGQGQSTQNSEPLNQYFMFSPNQERANDINWDAE